MSETGNQSLVPVDTVEQTGQLVPQRPLDLTRDLQLYWTNLPCETPIERLELVEHLNGPCLKLRDSANKTLDVVGMIVAQRNWIDDETGEAITGQPITLVCKDNTRHLVWGETARSCLSKIMAAVGRGPWNPPLPLIIGTATGRENRMIYQITVDRSYLKVLAQKKGK